MKRQKKASTRWEVQTYTLCDGWVNCWTVDGKPSTFPTRKAAQQELDDYIADVQQAVDDGDMMEPVNVADQRIMRVTKGANAKQSS